MTGGPQGMKSSTEPAAPTCEQPSKWSNQRRKYSERLADTARKAAPSLAEAGVRATPPRLEEDVGLQHLVSYVLAAKEPRKGCDPARFQRKLALRAALEETEAAERGVVCRLICAAISEVSSQGLRTEGHFLLELLAKPGEKTTAASMFHPDASALDSMLQAAVRGTICLRLAVKFSARFGYAPLPVGRDQLPRLFEEAASSPDRSRLAGLIEYLAACDSLELDSPAIPDPGR
eukprot:TRINITY_DN16732_c0_g1_i2.p1 TRINITY_DN16732_c0_g1~~TRINITY_DN16732_c0_g1_i2.p1  ORF type:complete len:233 (-),score=47.92 TRINITY_DN16732_c0_g1_i2:1167-1865(-)